MHYNSAAKQLKQQLSKFCYAAYRTSNRFFKRHVVLSKIENKLHLKRPLVGCDLADVWWL